MPLSALHLSCPGLQPPVLQEDSLSCLQGYDDEDGAPVHASHAAAVAHEVIQNGGELRPHLPSREGGCTERGTERLVGAEQGGSDPQSSRLPPEGCKEQLSVGVVHVRGGTKNGVLTLELRPVPGSGGWVTGSGPLAPKVLHALNWKRCSWNGTWQVCK